MASASLAQYVGAGLAAMLAPRTSDCRILIYQSLCSNADTHIDPLTGGGQMHQQTRTNAAALPNQRLDHAARYGLSSRTRLLVGR